MFYKDGQDHALLVLGKIRRMVSLLKTTRILKTPFISSLPTRKGAVFQPLANSDKTYDGNPYVHGEIIAKDTDWKNSDIAEIQKEIEQLYKEEKAAQKSAQEQADYTAELEEISSRRQTIDVLLSCGNWMPDEEERLSELRKEITAKGAVLDQLSQKSSKAFCPFCLGRTKNPHLYLNTEKNRFFLPAVRRTRKQRIAVCQNSRNFQ